MRKCLLKDFNSETFDNYCILQKHNKNTRNNNYSIRVPRVKLELARQSFYIYGGKLYNELLIGIRKLDTISQFKVALRGHFLQYSYLVVVHTYMYSGLSFFLNIHCFATYYFCSLFPFQEPLFEFYYLCPYSSSWYAIVDCVCIISLLYHVLYPLFSALTF